MLKFLILLILLLPVYNSPFETRQKQDKVYYFVYSQSTIHATSMEEANAVSKVLADHIRKKNRVLGNIEIIICKNKEELLVQLKKGYDFLVLSTEEFLMFHKQFNLVPSFTNESDGTIGFNYLLVVNKDDGVSDLSQLKGAEIYIQSQFTQKVPEILLNNLLKKQRLPELNKFFSKVNRYPSINNNVLPVFFKRAKVAMITEQSLKVLREINPQIEKQLKIIYRSPNLKSYLKILGKQ